MSLVKSKPRTASRYGSNLITQDPFFSDLLNSRNNLFNLNKFFNGDFGDEMNMQPALNVKDQKDQYEVELAAPGLDKQDFNITLEDGILTISAEKENKIEEEKEGFIRKEFNYNSFSRSMSLQESADENKEFKANYKEGILKLVIPKKEAKKAKPVKQIKIS